MADIQRPFFDLLMPFYTEGYWAVQLFWMISGFVFAYVYAQKKTSAITYFTNRFSRLYPLHLLTLVVIAIIQYASRKLLGYYQTGLNNDIYHFFLNVFFMAHWGFQQGYSFNSPIWSVSVEEGIFILFFFLHRIIFAGGSYLCAAIIGMGFAITITGKGVANGAPGTPLWEFGLCAFYFFTGVMLYFYSLRFRKYKILNFVLCLVSLTIFVVLLGKYRADKITSVTVPFTVVEYFLFIPVLLLAVLADFKFAGRSSWQKVVKWFKFIGDLTYSSYLIHFPIQVLILVVFHYFNLNQEIFNYKIVFLLWIAVVVVLSRLSFRYIEMPAKNYLRKTLPDRLTSAF